MSLVQDFYDMRPVGGYDLIMADPPWSFAVRSEAGITNKGASGQYTTQPLAWVAALPVSLLAADNCLLWLWATNPMLPQAFSVLNAWGFTFKTAGHWVKRTLNGKLAFGTGYILRCAGEPFLIGTRGAPKTTRVVRSVIEGPIREHSRKPDEAFSEAERLIPQARRIELFSRQKRPRWDVWGNQTELFEPAACLGTTQRRRTEIDRSSSNNAGQSRPVKCPGPRIVTDTGLGPASTESNDHDQRGNGDRSMASEQASLARAVAALDDRHAGSPQRMNMSEEQKAPKLQSAIDLIKRATDASRECGEGNWTGRDFAEEQFARDPNATDHAIAVILNAVCNDRLVRADLAYPVADEVALLKAETERLRVALELADEGANFLHLYDDNAALADGGKNE